MVPQSTTSNQNWKTPALLIDEIRDVLKFPVKFDMTSRNKAEVAPLLEIGANDNGLTEAWHPWSFYNPPFKQLPQWVARAVAEWKNRGITSVGVAPANLETKWAKALLDAEATLLVLSPRVNFTGTSSGAPHATMLMILGAESPYGDYGIFRHDWKRS